MESAISCCSRASSSAFSQGVADVALGAAALRLLQALLRFAQPFECGRRLRGCGRVAGCRRPAHRVRGLAQLAGRLRQLRPVFLARQLFEPPRGFLGLFRQRSLLIPAAAPGLHAGSHAPPLRLRFLFLAPRQLLQLLHELIELLIGVLIARALSRFVLVRHTIELELEQIGQILSHRALTATAAATALRAYLELYSSSAFCKA